MRPFRRGPSHKGRKAERRGARGVALLAPFAALGALAIGVAGALVWRARRRG